MTFNSGKYQATSTNTEKTSWSVKSHDGTESFTLEDMKVGTATNYLMKKTISSHLNDGKY